MAGCHSKRAVSRPQSQISIPSCDDLVATPAGLSTALLDDLGASDRFEVQGVLAGGDFGTAGGLRSMSKPPAMEGRGPLSNTPPTNRQLVPGASSAIGGLDWLEWCSYGSWEPVWWMELTRVLEAAKVQAQAAGSDVVVEVGGEPVRVLSSGVRRGMYCRWCFEWQGIEIAIADRMGESAHGFSVHLIARSTACMDLGVSVYARVCHLLEQLGYRQSRSIVSRIDLAVDLVGVPVSVFADAFSAGAVVCRARKRALYFDGVRYSGVTFGKAEVMLRCYDKRLEMSQSGDEVKWQVLMARRWNGERLPDAATRVEFQLKREALRAMSFDDVAKLLGNLKSVVEWLMNDWCRFTDGVADRSHTDRCESSALWRGIRDVLVVAFRSGEELPLSWRRKLEGDPSRLFKQAVGCLSSGLGPCCRDSDEASAVGNGSGRRSPCT
jgi:hypothetical protein